MDQINKIVRSQPACDARNQLLQLTERSDLVGFSGQIVGQIPFWLIGAIAAGERAAFFLRKLAGDLAAEPALSIKENIIETGLGCLRVGVELAHERRDLTESRGASRRTGVGFAYPAGTSAAQANQALVVRRTDSDLIAHLAHRRSVFQ
ncbi:hypothetical protein D3C77_542610 [compost metagenome]